METISLYLLSVVVVFVSLFYLGFLSQHHNSNRSKHPPGTFGLPVVGETLQFIASGPEKFIRQRMEKYSDQVFATSLLGEKVAIVCGAEGNRFVLHTASHLLLPWVPPAAAKIVNWKDSKGQSIKQMFADVRKFDHGNLRPEALKQYIPIMDSMARQHLKIDWDPFQSVKVYPVSQKFTLSVACKLVLGVENPDQVQRIYHSFSCTMEGLFSLPVNIPGTTYNRALKEVNILKQEFLKIIAERKKKVSENRERAGSDILSRMLLDEDAHLISDLDIAVRLISLVLPSYESTSASITFALNYLAELPHIYDMVYNELVEIAKSKAPEELLNFEDISKMKYCWNVICEAMRLIPPTMGTFRETPTDMNFADITIPKGWKVFWSPFTTNKNPKYFPDPETFDPTRFEGDGPTPCSFTPFSSGPRICPGKEYSKFLILVYMYNIVNKFKLQKLNQDGTIIYRAGPVPSDGLPMLIQPH